MSDFRPRFWLVDIAAALPPRLSWLALWIISRETRRAERHLNPPSGGFMGFGLGGAIMNATTHKRAFEAQRAAAMAAFEEHRRQLAVIANAEKEPGEAGP